MRDESLMMTINAPDQDGGQGASGYVHDHDYRRAMANEQDVDVEPACRGC